jgi:Abortive infection C-terminus
MSSLSLTEKAKLEKLLDMRSGYVWGFSDTTFGNFIADVVGLDIHNTKYQGAGTSKAKKLREFWRVEPDYVVGKATLALIQYVEENLPDSADRYAEKQLLYEPCKAIARRLMSGTVSLDELKQTAVAFDAKHLADQIRRIEQSVDSDPALAIGTAKELVETCCKTILGERGKQITGTPDISILTKATLKELHLVPEDVSEAVRGGDVIRKILHNLGAIGNGLAELRGLYGTGHGREGRATGLKARHAKLAVGAASTLVSFLFDTHKETMP